MRKLFFTIDALVQFRYCDGMADTSDPIIRKTVSLPTSVWKRIEDFQFDRRIKRDTEAIRRLVELGLEASKTKESAQ